jgi:hypothetical protein
VYTVAELQILAIGVVSVFYWRRHRLSGLSFLCPAPLVIALNLFPDPADSPAGMGRQCGEGHLLLRRFETFLSTGKEERATSSVGQVYTDGFGSLTAGLAVVDPVKTDR